MACVMDTYSMHPAGDDGGVNVKAVDWAPRDARECNVTRLMISVRPGAGKARHEKRADRSSFQGFATFGRCRCADAETGYNIIGLADIGGVSTTKRFDGPR